MRGKFWYIIPYILHSLTFVTFSTRVTMYLLFDKWLARYQKYGFERKRIQHYFNVTALDAQCKWLIHDNVKHSMMPCIPVWLTYDKLAAISCLSRLFNYSSCYMCFAQPCTCQWHVASEVDCKNTEGHLTISAIRQADILMQVGPFHLTVKVFLV